MVRGGTVSCIDFTSCQALSESGHERVGMPQLSGQSRRVDRASAKIVHVVLYVGVTCIYHLAAIRVEELISGEQEG